MTQTQPNPTPQVLAARLSELLSAYAARYEALHAHALAQREALRRADGAGVEAAAAQAGAVLAEIAGLDRRRNELVNQAAAVLPALSLRRGAPVTLGEIAAALPVAGAGELQAAAGRVRELVRRTSDLVRAVAAATRAMMLHVEGLMRQVDRHLSHAGTYGRRGTVEAGGPVLSALDLRT